jgi:DHA1 family multidrug resistance protein-like MFS transporter
MVRPVRLSGVESRRTLAIYVATGASFAAISARGLLVPLYAHQLGADRFHVGALFSVSMLAAALLSMPSGVLIDRFGARSMLGLAVGVSAVSQLATAETVTVGPLFLWQVLGGLATGGQMAAVLSVITESEPASRLGRAMGWLTFSMQAGFFLGPSIAALSLQWLDLRADIAVMTILLAFAVPGAMLATTTRQSVERLSLRVPLLRLVGQPSFVPVTIGLLAATLVWGTVGAFLPIFGKESLGLPSPQVGFLLALQAVVNGVSRLPGGRLVDRARQRWPIVFVGVIAWSVASILLGHLNGFWLPALLLVIATPLIATAFVAIGVVFADLSAGSTRGVAMGAYGSVLFLGLAAGPLVFGPVVQNYGYAAGFTSCAVVAMALAAVMAALHAEPRRPRTEIPMPPVAPGT